MSKNKYFNLISLFVNTMKAVGSPLEESVNPETNWKEFRQAGEEKILFTYDPVGPSDLSFMIDSPFEKTDEEFAKLRLISDNGERSPNLAVLN